jgi:Protein of unknown function (DUF2510)
MTTQPGWYPDPQAPHRTRWWDGGQWTSHTAVRAGHQFFAAYPAASAWWVDVDEPPRRKPRGPKIVVTVGIAIVVGYLAVVAFVVMFGTINSRG